MLYFKDNVIKDNNQIVIKTSDSVIYNPDHQTLLDNGWTQYDGTNYNATKVFENRGFVTTTPIEFSIIDKSDYKDSIVLINEDTTGQIWSNGVYYGGVSPTHFWNGTKLAIVDVNGIGEEVDLKGEKGEQGDQGIQGPQGIQGLNGAFSSTYESTTETLILDSDLEDAYYNTPFVSMEETTFEIEPNKYYCWGEPVSTLTITLKEPTNTNILNIYSLEFTTSDSGCTLMLPQTVKWMGGESPEVEPSTTYQISITNNLAIIQGFTYAE